MDGLAVFEQLEDPTPITVVDIDTMLEQYAQLKQQEAELKEQLDTVAMTLRMMANGLVDDRSKAGWRIVKKRTIRVVDQEKLRAAAPELFKESITYRVNQTALTDRWKSGNKDGLEELIVDIDEMVLCAETRKGRE